MLATTIVVSTIGGGALALAGKVMIDAAVDGRPTDAAIAAVIGGISHGVLVSGMRLWFNLGEVLASKVAILLDREILSIMASLDGLEHLDRPDVQDEMSLVTGRGTEMAAATTAAIGAVALILQLLVSVGLLALVDPRLTLLALATIPIAFSGALSEQRVRDRQTALASDSRLADHVHGQFLDPAALREIRVFGAGSTLDLEARTASTRAANGLLRVNLGTAGVNLLGWGPLLVGLALGLVLTAQRAIDGTGTIGDLLLVAQIGRQLHAQGQQASSTARSITGSMATVGRLRWLQGYAESNKLVYRAGTRQPPTTLDLGVAIEGLRFRYPGASEDALSDVDVLLPAGSTVAVVGDNGAGKSTLVKLLCRMLEPTEGRILVDGVPLDEFDLDRWRTSLSASFQDYARIEAQARASVGVGLLPAIGDDAKVLESLRQAAASSLIDDWPDGLDSHLGRSYAPGVEPSGGGWQKIAVARAMMRPDPLLLLLDEPSASLDPLSESQLLQMYNKAAIEMRARGGITLVVSHRFSTVRWADLIVVLDDGRAVEVGDHESLMGERGRYWEMFSAQAAEYVESRR